MPVLAFVITGLSLSLFSACVATQPALHPVPLPESFQHSGPTPLDERWWRAFGDAHLDRMVERALHENFNLRAAWSRLRQADAIARREGAALVPSLDVELSTTRTEITQTAAAGAGVRGRNDYRAGVSAAYEIDLWGRIGAGRDAARIDAILRADERDAAAMSIAAEIARAWFDLAEQHAQAELLLAQIATNEHLLAVMEARFRAGQVGAADVLRQRQLLAATRGERALVEAGRAVQEHRIAVLIGAPPGTIELPAHIALPERPPLPDIGVPADVVARRPDVRASYAAILAADRRLAVAKADRYPRLTLTGASAFTAREIRDVFDNWLATFTAALVAPIIDGRRRSAEVEYQRALVEERAHGYAETVLASLAEVEDALARERALSSYLTHIEEQLDLAQAAAERLRQQYRHGAVGFLDVLDAVSSQQTLERARAVAVRDALEQRVALHRAVGGAFALDETDRDARIAVAVQP